MQRLGWNTFSTGNCKGSNTKAWLWCLCHKEVTTTTSKCQSSRRNSSRSSGRTKGALSVFMNCVFKNIVVAVLWWDKRRCTIAKNGHGGARLQQHCWLPQVWADLKGDATSWTCFERSLTSCHLALLQMNKTYASRVPRMAPLPTDLIILWLCLLDTENSTSVTECQVSSLQHPREGFKMLYQSCLQGSDAGPRSVFTGSPTYRKLPAFHILWPCLVPCGQRSSDLRKKKKSTRWGWLDIHWQLGAGNGLHSLHKCQSNQRSRRPHGMSVEIERTPH